MTSIQFHHLNLHKAAVKLALRCCALLAMSGIPPSAMAQSGEGSTPLDLSIHWVGFAPRGIFFLAYVFAMFEERTMLRKSKPMVFAASLIWVLIASVYVTGGIGETQQHFDVFHNFAQLEWDTLLFFHCVMVRGGGLSFLGYGTLASELPYTDLDPTVANILVGIVSAFIDNATIMYAVLTMAPDLSQGQWLPVTLTAGIGGGLLAIRSAAGVGLLGQAKGAYTFVSHMKWVPVIALGYAASILAHFLINERYF